MSVPAAPDGDRGGPSIGGTIRAVLRRLVSPRVWFRRRVTSGGTGVRDPQLDFYARISDGGHLHYGYFDDPGTRPEAISLEDLHLAQERYCEVILEHLVDRVRPVLDAGCGAGGLLAELIDRGFDAFGLTPDDAQIISLRERFPGDRLIHTWLGTLDAERHAESFGTVITAESFQYMGMDRVLPVIARILVPGGRWILFDFFRTDDDRGGAGQSLPRFRDRIATGGWRTLVERDETAHLLPTLAWFHMWADRLLDPLIDFAGQKVGKDRPRTAEITAPALEHARDWARRNVAVIDPARFAERKRYMLFVLEPPRAGSSGAGPPGPGTLRRTVRRPPEEDRTSR